jgi:hypothetical protein
VEREEHRAGKAEPGREDHRSEAPAARQPVETAVDVAAVIGNQAFAALAQGATPSNGAGPATLARIPGGARRVAREPTGGGTTTAAPPQGGGSTAPASPQAAPAKPWVAPFDWGFATTGGGAVDLLGRIRDDADELVTTGFPELAIHSDEAKTWIGNFSDPAQFLTDDQVQKLTAFSGEFQAAYTGAIGHLRDAIVGQLEAWGVRPMTEEDLVDLKEMVHEKFVHSAQDDVLGEAVELLEKATGMVGQVDKWVGYGAKAKGVIAGAEKLEQLKEGIKEISDKVGEIKEYFELAHNIGKLTGVIGKSPAGNDDIGSFEGALDVSNFVMSKLGVPGIKQLWDGYIYKAAKAAAVMLRNLKSTIYTENREGAVPLFFMEHRGDAVAPKIDDSLVRGVDKGEHFPGGQPMLDFMWTFVKAPDALTKVPEGVEKYFLDWKKQMGEGEGTDQIQSDSSVWNLWNAFSREESPNLVPWLKRHADDAWVKLYGGMQKPD